MSVVKVNEAVSKKQAQVITNEIYTAISEILKKHNLKIEKQNTKYGSAYQYRIDAVAVELVNGVNVASVEAQEWYAHASWYFNVSNHEKLLGAEISANGGKYKLAGCNINKKTKPVLIIDAKTGEAFHAPKDILTKVKGIKFAEKVSAHV